MKISRVFLLGVASLLVVFGALAEENPSFYAVSEVPNGKTVILENGETVRLVAIQAPNVARDRNEESEPLAEEARDALKAFLGNKVRLEPIEAGRDHRGRVLALVYNEEGELAQANQLKLGYAWVYSFADTRELAKELLSHEAEAEIAKRGIWQEAEYAVLNELNAEKYVGDFRLVTGDVDSVSDLYGKINISFGSDWKTDFTVQVERDNVKHFPEGWAESLVGKEVRVRGWLFDRNGAMITLSHPEQLELVNEAP